MKKIGQGDHGSWKNGDFEKLGWKSRETSTIFSMEGWKSWNFQNVQLRF